MDKAQIEALRDLTQSPGWALYREHVMHEITGQFEEDITKALNHPEGPIAIDRMRQVAAVRLAGLRWLQWPQERVKTLTDQLERKDEQQAMVIGRRPVGL